MGAGDSAPADSPMQSVRLIPLAPGAQGKQSGFPSYVRKFELAAALPPATRVFSQHRLYSRVGTGRLAHPAQLKPAPRDLHIHVSFCPARKLLEDVVRADCFRDRPVDAVEPAGGGLRQRNRTALFEAQEVAVTKDVVEDLVVPPKPAALEACLGPGAVKLGRLKKRRILGRPQQAVRVDAWLERRPGAHLDDAGVDGVAADIARD